MAKQLVDEKFLDTNMPKNVSDAPVLGTSDTTISGDKKEVKKTKVLKGFKVVYDNAGRVVSSEPIYS